jgi:aminopeptidase N
VLSLLRGFSAPVKIHYPYSDEELMFLMSHDTDGFARWDASQTLAQRVLLGMVSQRQQGQAMSLPDGFMAAFRNALLDENSDKALIAEVLTLPSESYLGDQMRVVDVDSLFIARETLKKWVAEALSEDLMMVYESNREIDEYSIKPEAIARRSLKNTVLSYLVMLQDHEVQQVCLNQYGAGKNMTDVMAAFSLIADSYFSEREEILSDFENRWQHAPLVMDKWFTAQAVSRRDDTLANVERLMQHPLFSMRNPNKVRALIGAFCSANPVRFHQADGRGYAFLADRVIELDALNPQVAARMLRIVSRWHRYDENRQKLIKAQLERIVSVDTISRDVYEIASKSLNPGA